jgi:hypothetical protein
MVWRIPSRLRKLHYHKIKQAEGLATSSPLIFFPNAAVQLNSYPGAPAGHETRDKQHERHHQKDMNKA